MLRSALPLRFAKNFRSSRLGERQSRNSLRRAAKPSDKKMSLPLVAQEVKRHNLASYVIYLHLSPFISFLLLTKVKLIIFLFSFYQLQQSGDGFFLRDVFLHAYLSSV